MDFSKNIQKNTFYVIGLIKFPTSNKQKIVQRDEIDNTQ